MTNPKTRPGYSIYRRKDSRHLWLKLSYNGRTYCESTKTDNLTKAENRAKVRIAELRTDTFISPQARRTRVEELMGDVFTDYAVNAKRSLADAKARWLLHLKPFFGHLRAVDIGTYREPSQPRRSERDS